MTAEQQTQTSSHACTECGKTSVKLWRVHGEFFPPFTILCMQHMFDYADVADDFTLDDDGGYFDDETHRRSYVLGWCVPAVLHPYGDGWWGVTNIPPEDFDKWKALPND